MNDGTKNILLSFEDGISKSKCDFLSQIPKNVNYISLVKPTCFKVFWNEGKGNVLKKNKYALELEKKNIFCDIKLDEIIQTSLKRKKLAYVFGIYDSKKTVYFFPNVIEKFQYNTKNTKKIKKFERKNFDVVNDVTIEELLKGEKLNLTSEKIYNKCVEIQNLKSLFYNSRNKLHVISLCSIETLINLNRKKIKIKINDKIYPLQMMFKKGKDIKDNKGLNFYHFSIPFEDCKNFELHNKIKLVYKDKKGYGFEKVIKLKEEIIIHAPVKILKDINTAVYFRKTEENSLCLTVRDINVTDSIIEKIKIRIAWIMSKIIKKQPILLFEKHCARYEESASVLYEKLIDLGYKNTYFILDKNYSYINEISPKYRNNIIYKYSLKHYLYIFSCNTFMSSEAISHACEVRTTNKLINEKLKDSTLNYVFLQHGVMYMVSLNSKARKFFHKKKTKGLKRVVVSSHLEENHFVDFGEYNEKDIYVCGIPKFDRNKWNKNADKIIIMPTWRPWEYNQARLNFTETKYYKMTKKK